MRDDTAQQIANLDRNVTELLLAILDDIAGALDDIGETLDDILAAQAGKPPKPPKGTK